MLDVSSEQLQVLHHIFNQYLSQGEVRAFGSRVYGNAKPYSDLDLMLRLDKPIDIRTMGRLREAIQASILPFRVDLVDWHQSSKAFQDIMIQKSEVIWPLG